MKLVSVEEMLTIEKQADSAGLSYTQMMENAGRGLAGIVRDLDVGTPEREILALVGPGNNGGDALVALSYLAEDSWRAHAYLIKRNSDPLVERLRKAGGAITTARDDRELAALAELLGSADVVLDGVLGTGTRPPLRGEVADILGAAQRILRAAEQRPYVIAVDCPSGVDCDSGEAADECIQADLTVTMAGIKQGLLKLPAYSLMGDLRVIDIAIPRDLPALASIAVEVAEELSVVGMMPRRPVDAHKGTFGTAVIAAGSINYTGAALLAGAAAYRAGAGLVTLAVPAPIHAALAGRLPEATWILLPHELGVISRDAADVLAGNLDTASALLIGPGLGTETTTADFVVRLLAGGSGGTKAPSMGFIGTDRGTKTPEATSFPATVFDADGLKLLAKMKDWHRFLPGPAVLTPHPGEMAAMTGLSKDEIQRDRRAIAVRFARDWGHVVVLKGAFTVVASPDERVTVIPVASPSLARAGTGDVLAGLIVGLKAQGVAPYESAVAGAWIHAHSGLYAARRLGTAVSVLAGDVLDSISDVIADLPGE